MARGLPPGLLLRSTHAALTKKDYSLKQKEVQWKSRIHKGLVDSALQGHQQESRFFPSRPGWSSTLTSSSGGQQAPAVVGGSSRQHPGQAEPAASLASREDAAFHGRAQQTHLPFHWTESDHMANPEPITRKGWKPNKPNPGPRVWPFPSYKGPQRRGGPCPKLRLCEEEGNGSCKTSNSIHKQAFWPGQDAHQAKTGHPEDKPSQKIITSAFTV